MKAARYLVYFVLQWTWGMIQSVFGLMLFLRYVKCPHEFYHGSVLTWHDGDWGGVSLGMFIFVNGGRGEDWRKDARVHEYGHTIQSLILGPLYMFLIGLPSAVWCNGKKFNSLRESGKATYYDFYPESWANRLGACATGEPLPLWEHTLADIERRKREKAGASD